MNLTLTELRGAYAENKVTPREVMAIVAERCEQYRDHNIWIHQLTAAELEPYLQRLETSPVDALPLYGIPFAIKDNIDLAGVPTTAACDAFAYTEKPISINLRPAWWVRAHRGEPVKTVLTPA